MARIPGADPDRLPPEVAGVFEEQKKRWGETLEPFHLYARLPPVFLAVRGMWRALGESGKLSPGLRALVCRRVASLNDCPF